MSFRNDPDPLFLRLSETPLLLRLELFDTFKHPNRFQFLESDLPIMRKESVVNSFPRSDKVLTAHVLSANMQLVQIGLSEGCRS